jgi:hypothetical protein
MAELDMKSKFESDDGGYDAEAMVVEDQGIRLVVPDLAALAVVAADTSYCVSLMIVCCDHDSSQVS